MDIEQILAALRQERENIDQEILSMERLAWSRPRRRGRPPAWVTEITKKRHGRPPAGKDRPKSRSSLS